MGSHGTLPNILGRVKTGFAWHLTEHNGQGLDHAWDINYAILGW
jgi:hypothetical protein